jgi:hypothetical protein
LTNFTTPDNKTPLRPGTFFKSTEERIDVQQNAITITSYD